MGIAVGVIGGLGLFLYGMNLMGSALQRSAGSKLKKLVEILTKNRFIGVLVGVIVTMVIQSSSATTVMVVGFVNAGIMTLKQAIGVIMGANLGTTVTAQLIAFDLAGIAPLAVGLGVVLSLASKKSKMKDISEIIIGFGVLFIGMSMMSSSLKPLSSSQMFIDLLSGLKNPFIGMLVGFLLTTILQSSSAAIGLLLALASQGLLDIDMTLPILFGDNIGTTTTAMLSSIGASRVAKQAALMHFLFNLIGTIIFITILRKPVELFVLYLSPGDVSRQIANAHTLFNLLNIVIQFPFAALIVKAAEKIIKTGVEKEKTMKYIDYRLMETPSLAVSQGSKEVLRMGKKALENIELAKEAFKNMDYELTNKIKEREKLINAIQTETTRYLAEVSNLSLTNAQHRVIMTLFNAMTDIERIGDHAENIADQTQYAIENNLNFSDKAKKELDMLFDKTIDLYKNSLLAFKKADEDIAKEVIMGEAEIDKLEKFYRASHIERINKYLCNPSSGIVYLDLIANLERVSDHSVNISQYIVEVVEKQREESFF
ncbi:MAG: Na/Pi cotransporter family protein [Andreesenia angusta]|nr:Na/Pi cotransporter family protein [Andreesenia angusta]